MNNTTRFRGIVGFGVWAVASVALGQNPQPITVNQANGDDTVEITSDVSTADDHSVTTTDDHSVSTTDDHSVSIDTDNSTTTDNSIGELLTTVEAVGQPLHRAEGAASVRGYSIPSAGPCGEVTGLSAQTGIAGGALSTVPEACRAFRVDEYERLSRSRARMWAVRLVYWAGLPSRLALAMVSGGALN